MFNKIYKFLNNDNLICHVQFGFRWKYSAVHVFISLTENIRKSLDEGNVGCGIFVDLFFYRSLNIMVCVVLLINGLNLISQIENCFFNHLLWF